MYVILNSTLFDCSFLKDIPSESIITDKLHIVGLDDTYYSIPLKSINKIIVQGSSMIIIPNDNRWFRWFNLGNIISMDIDRRGI